MANLRRSSPVTLKHVAAEAGVSIAAASRVLHGRGSNIRVSPEKTLAIQEAARNLSYVPNALAQSMRLGKTGSIGLIFDRFGRISTGPLFYVQMLEGVMGEVFPSGRRLTIFPEVDVESPLACVVDGSVDGLIWCKAPDTPEVLAIMKSSAIPVVALNSRPPESEETVTYVSCDNEGGSFLIAEHLLSLGHERILFVMEQGETDTPDALSRLAGFKNACRRLKIPFDEATDLVIWDAEAKQVSDWLRSKPSHTAIYGWNEGFASRIMNQLLACGIRVPEDISLVGFDSTQFCDSLTPGLTAARQPILEMSSYATRLLMELVEEGSKRRKPDVIFPCTLDVRGSTGPARTRPSLAHEAEAFAAFRAGK